MKKKGTKASRTLPDNFSDQTAKFVAEMRREVEEGRIPGDLIINIDRMGIKIVPCSEWTLDVIGSKQVAITGLHHKRIYCLIRDNSLRKAGASSVYLCW